MQFLATIQRDGRRNFTRLFVAGIMYCVWYEINHIMDIVNVSRFVSYIKSLAKDSSFSKQADGHVTVEFVADTPNL